MKFIKLKLVSATFVAATVQLFADEVQRNAVENDPALALPEYLVVSERVANQEPGGTLPMPVSGLRFEPRVDVQGRNLAEAQADVTLRGGIFENTGFKVGGSTLFDPQTGHYFAEIPVPPAMLSSPEILTGRRNAVEGFNAGVGTIAYGWRPVETRGELSLAAGDHGFRRGGIYQGAALDLQGSGVRVGADVEVAHSQSDGAVPFGEHDFDRVAGRFQVRTAQTQTDLFAGYQAKFFGWPNLYTPFGFNETENLQTVLALANHRWSDGSGSFLQATAHYRRNKDDYEFNRAVPGASNPFLHTTWTAGAGIEGRHQRGDLAVAYSLQVSRDELESTALTAGRFRERAFRKFSIAPERRWDLESGAVTAHAGLAYDDSDRNPSRLSPLAGIDWELSPAHRVYAEYSETTQLPTYTALNSSATSGLFRGNAALGRTVSGNLEAGFESRMMGWEVSAALFRRQDDNLVDWTYQRGVVARTANAVDIATTGLEIVAMRRSNRLDLIVGYTLLAKDADYGLAAVDASFYALNFAKHRLTAAVRWRMGAGFEVRSDNEYRVQEDNFLRTAGGDEAFVSSLGLYYLPPRLGGFEFSVLVDNLWDSDFQEVPAVPAAGRQISLGMTMRW